MSGPSEASAAHDAAVMGGHYTLGAAVISLMPALITALLAWWRRHSIAGKLEAQRAESAADRAKFEREISDVREEALREARRCREDNAFLRSCIAELVAVHEVSGTRNAAVRTKVHEIRLKLAEHDGRRQHEEQSNDRG